MVVRIFNHSIWEPEANVSLSLSTACSLQPVPGWVSLNLHRPSVKKRRKKKRKDESTNLSMGKLIYILWHSCQRHFSVKAKMMYNLEFQALDSQCQIWKITHIKLPYNLVYKTFFFCFLLFCLFLTGVFG